MTARDACCGHIAEYRTTLVYGGQVHELWQGMSGLGEFHSPGCPNDPMADATTPTSKEQQR